MVSKWMCALIALSLLSACGLKGDLKRPSEITQEEAKKHEGTI